jgi:hypothetical protein
MLSGCDTTTCPSDVCTMRSKAPSLAYQDGSSKKWIATALLVLQECVSTVRAFMALHFGDGAIQLLRATNRAGDVHCGSKFLPTKCVVMARNLRDSDPS